MHRDTIRQQALELAFIAAQCRAVTDLQAHLCPALASALGGHLVIFHQIDTVSGIEIGVPWPAGDRYATDLRHYGSVMMHSPLIRHFRTVPTARVVRLSDLLARRRWHDNPVYRESHRALDIDDHLVMAEFQERGVGFGISVGRSGTRFPESARSLATLVEPHLRVAIRRCLQSFSPYRALTITPQPAWYIAVGPAVVTSAGKSPLTPRQRQVMGLIAAGRSNQQISRSLGVSVRTVDKHVELAFRSLDAHSRTEAVGRWAVSQSSD